MNLPENYDPRLSDILDTHTAQGVVPEWYVVRYLDIAQDFSTFLKGNSSLEPNHILDLGGRSLPYLDFLKPKKITTIEPRTKYTDIAKALYKEVNLLSSDPDVSLAGFDLILINLELGGICGNSILADFNKGFVKDLPVFGYCYNAPNLPKCGLGFMDDGEIYDGEKQKKWAKSMSNHMHMGLKKSAFEFVTFYNLCREY